MPVDRMRRVSRRCVVVTRREERACRVVLVRHASAEGQGGFLGQLDAPLSAIGRKELPGLVKKLRRHTIDAVYCSDLSRATETADAVARCHGRVVEIRPPLREMHFGRWEGLAWEDILDRFPQLARRWLTGRGHPRVPGGEPFSRFRQRIGAELKQIVGSNPGRSVAVVTHAGVIRVALGAALGMPDRHLFRIAQPPCAVNVIDHFRTGAIVRCINA